jgi:putative SOS response-associated peptidase YedK
MMINARSENGGDQASFQRGNEIPGAWFQRMASMNGRCVGAVEDAGSNVVESCSILTTTPNAVAASVHDRMPVIVEPDGYDLWLDPGMKDASVVSELLKPYDARAMRAYPVSPRVSSAANDDPECSSPVELADIQSQLF